MASCRSLLQVRPFLSFPGLQSATKLFVFDCRAIGFIIAIVTNSNQVRYAALFLVGIGAYVLLFSTVILSSTHPQFSLRTDSLVPLESFPRLPITTVAITREPRRLASRLLLAIVSACAIERALPNPRYLNSHFALGESLRPSFTPQVQSKPSNLLLISDEKPDTDQVPRFVKGNSIVLALLVFSWFMVVLNMSVFFFSTSFPLIFHPGHIVGMRIKPELKEGESTTSSNTDASLNQGKPEHPLETGIRLSASHCESRATRFVVCKPKD